MFTSDFFPSLSLDLAHCSCTPVNCWLVQHHLSTQVAGPVQDIKDKIVISVCSSSTGRSIFKHLVSVYVRFSLEIITGFCEHLGKGSFM